MGKSYYPVQELFLMQIPGMPKTTHGIRARAQSQQWPSRKVPGRGGPGGQRFEYQPPPEIQREIDAIEAGKEGLLPRRAGEPPFEYHGEKSTPLLREVVIALERAIKERQLSPDPEIRADAIAMAYDLCLFTRDPVEIVVARVLPMLEAAAR